MGRLVATTIILIAYSVVLFPGASAAPDRRQIHFLEAITTPQNLTVSVKQKPIVIAIVDDGVRITHQELRRYIWTNTDEIPDNQLDDDGNGYIDDIHGWDVADDNNTVEPPPDRLEFYHGTHLAGIVAQVATHAYGEAAAKHIQIMPIKSLEDSAGTRYLKQAYDGIQYAIEAGADIILCSWTLSTISPEESRILRRAADAGILIIASAGNFPEERDQFPAADPGSIAVTSIDQNGQKVTRSNFGPFIDLVAPGESIEAAGGVTDDAYRTLSGTSGAAAMVAAAAALVKVQHPLFSAGEVKACLMSSARPIRPKTEAERGKLGAGVVDIAAAVDCALLMSGTMGESYLDLPKAYLRPASDVLDPITWVIEPDGDINGVNFSMVFNRHNTTDGALEFSNGDSPDTNIVASYSLPDLPDNLYVVGTKVQVRYLPENNRRHDWLLRYEVNAIDARTRYCKGIVNLETEGELADGSGNKEYSYGTDCKWLITAPPGKLIQFSFSHLDTESRVDMVYFFNGAATHEDIMAIFSGTVVPPVLTTWSNQVLVWFVTNGENQGQGWRANYRFVDEAAP